MKFSANLSFMFGEAPSLVERYRLARNAGFRFVESAFPPGVSLTELVAAKEAADVEQVLINISTGPELGVACDPSKEVEFSERLSTTMQYAEALRCPRIHIMAGVLKSPPTDAHWAAYERSLRYAVDVLAPKKMIALIEPINRRSVADYFLDSYDRALGLIRKIDSPHLRLMLDVFHLQRIKGNITDSIDEYLPFVGHVQIAQVPNRNEPNTPGEVNYEYVLKHLELRGYEGFVGLEYKPLDGSAKGLSWIKEYGYTL